eukprot:TRINITY_DN232_c0_g1_i3.p1 TRINITY_DN232_c0_g1~~TRINITY_DN232_c0_g1_i3.p1  ORF type:complete len:145 (-),score=42.69 TRINITY_DN232_c0_g1_i3:18-452(-)
MNYCALVNFLVLAKIFTSLAFSVKNSNFLQDHIDTHSISRTMKIDRDEHDDNEKLDDEYDYFYYEDDEGRRVYNREFNSNDIEDDHKEGIVYRVSIFEAKLRSALAHFKKEIREEMRQEMREIAKQAYIEFTSDEDSDSDSDEE